MAKPFREEDIPSFLDRETGKFKPLFNMPGQKEENKSENPVPDIGKSIEEQLADAVEELHKLKVGIKNEFKAAFGEDFVKEWDHAFNFVEPIADLLDESMRLNNDVAFYKKKVEELENSLLQKPEHNDVQPVKTEEKQVSAPKKTKKTGSKTNTKTKKTTKKAK